VKKLYINEKLFLKLREQNQVMKLHINEKLFLKLREQNAVKKEESPHAYVGPIKVLNSGDIYSHTHLLRANRPSPFSPSPAFDVSLLPIFFMWQFFLRSLSIHFYLPLLHFPFLSSSGFSLWLCPVDNTLSHIWSLYQLCNLLFSHVNQIFHETYNALTALMVYIQ
jgi:hypothetical protein